MSNSHSISINTIAIPLIAISALTALCYFASSILVPIVTSITLAYVLWPLVELLKRIKIPHVLAVIIIMLLTLLIVFLLGMLIYGEVKDFAETSPTYWNNFQQLANRWIENYQPLDDDYLQQQAESFLKEVDISSLASIPKYLFKGIGSALSAFGQIVLVLLLTFFMLLEQKTLRQKLSTTFGREKISVTSEMISEISAKMASYIAVRAVTTLGLAIIFTVGLLIGGVKYAYIWGPLAALLNLIPYVGAFIGAIPPMVMVAVQHGSLLPMLWVFIFFMVIQVIESNIITPKLVGSQLNISLLVQLIATIYWGWLWGAIGIVLAVPITAAFKVLCDNVDTLKPIAILLSGDKN